MFRGTGVDEDDCALLIRSEQVDLEALIERYIETARFYYNPPSSKTHLKYLLTNISKDGLATDSLWRRYEEWIP